MPPSAAGHRNGDCAPPRPCRRPSPASEELPPQSSFPMDAQNRAQDLVTSILTATSPTQIAPLVSWSTPSSAAMPLTSPVPSSPSAPPHPAPPPRLRVTLSATCQNPLRSPSWHRHIKLLPPWRRDLSPLLPPSGTDRSVPPRLPSTAPIELLPHLTRCSPLLEGVNHLPEAYCRAEPIHCPLAPFSSCRAMPRPISLDPSMPSPQPDGMGLPQAAAHAILAKEKKL